VRRVLVDLLEGAELAIFGPITSERKRRDFGVIDLEWVPGEILPLPRAAMSSAEGIRSGFKIPLPVGKRMTSPLKLRIAGYYEMTEEDRGEDTVSVEDYQCFNTISDLLSHTLVRERRGMWFYAHAGGLADMQFVLDEILKEVKSSVPDRTSMTREPDPELKARGVDLVTDYGRGSYRVRASFSGSSAIIVHVSRGKNAWHFIDSYWLLRDKLENIGKAIGIEKGAKEKRMTQAEARDFYSNAPTDELTAYNKVDCEILWKSIKAFEDELLDLGGQLQQTIASTGMNLFRRVYLKRVIYTSERVNKIAEESYFASRVEVLSRYVEDYYSYDINSSFPFAMTFPQPAGIKDVSTKLPDSDEESCIYIADVTIEVPEMDLPPVPFRKDGRVFFPVGRWRSWLTSVDIRLALREGCKLHKVHEVYSFEPFNDLRGYAEDIYAKRAASTTDMRKLVLKYLLNSLYGKYAESPWKQEMLINPSKIDREKCQMLQPGVWLRDKLVPVTHRHVPISTHITSIARRTLYDGAKECYRQGFPIFYCDSITGDRTVVLKSPKGEVIVEPVNSAWKIVGGDPGSHRSYKEAVVARPGWMALAKDANGKEGWFPLKKIIRHETKKKVYLISSKRGQVEVTADHSLMVKGKEVKPGDFIRRNMQFDTVSAPPSVPLGKVDLLDHVCDFKRTLGGRRGRGKGYSYEIENRVSEFDSNWLRYETVKGSEQLIKRHYRSGSPEFRSLLRVLAAYISEGSASIRYLTSMRDMFSISQAKKQWLLDLKSDLVSITKKISLLGPKWSPGSNAYYLRSGAGLLTFVFAALGGVGSKNKKLPSFIYSLTKFDFLVFWRKLVEGDGSVDVGGMDNYSTSSQQLAAGLSFALSQHGFEHSIHYREDKRGYTIRLRPEGSERRRWTTKVSTSVVDGFVYDLEVEGAHTFVDGLGRVLLHNTDSIKSKAILTSDDKKLGMFKLEKKISVGEHIAPKIYMDEGLKLKKDGTWAEDWTAKAKGFSLDYISVPGVDDASPKAAYEKLARVAAGDRVSVQRMVRLRELYRLKDGAGYLSSPVEVLVIKALTFEMLSKRFHYPDGETRPWSVAELRSGEIYPRGFDFEPEVASRIDVTTRAMMEAAV